MIDSGTSGSQSELKLFTQAEAEAMLPIIVPVLARLRDDKRQLDQARNALGEVSHAMRANGHGREAQTLEDRIGELIARLAAGVDEINGYGIAIKDIDQGLVDFPSWYGERVVYLCWRLGEERIAFWHELDAGFAGRQPI